MRDRRQPAVNPRQIQGCNLLRQRLLGIAEGIAGLFQQVWPSLENQRPVMPPHRDEDGQPLPQRPVQLAGVPPGQHRATLGVMAERRAPAVAQQIILKPRRCFAKMGSSQKTEKIVR